MTAVSFRVDGVARPQGSKRQVRTTHGRHLMIEDNPETRPWRDTVRWHALQARNGTDLVAGPVAVRINAYLPRPKSHYRRDGTVKPTAPLWHTSKPDSDKLARLVLDALSGSVFRDDSQVTVLQIRKAYDTEPHLTVIVRPL